MYVPWWLVVALLATCRTCVVLVASLAAALCHVMYKKYHIRRGAVIGLLPSLLLRYVTEIGARCGMLEEVVVVVAVAVAMMMLDKS